MECEAARVRKAPNTKTQNFIFTIFTTSSMTKGSNSPTMQRKTLSVRAVSEDTARRASRCPLWAFAHDPLSQRHTRKPVTTSGWPELKLHKGRAAWPKGGKGAHPADARGSGR